MPWCSWIRHQSFLMVLRLFERPTFLRFQIFHPVDRVPGTHHHAAPLVRRVRHAQQHGPAQVGVHVNRREQSAETDEVVHVVDVVRVPVVFLVATEERHI